MVQEVPLALLLGRVKQDVIELSFSLERGVCELSHKFSRGLLTPIVFVINNSGYTIERCIHGEHRFVPFASFLVNPFLRLHRHYNDVANWKWTALLDAMNDSGKHKTVSYTIRTKDKLERLLVNAAFAKAKNMQLVEVIMDKFDAPRALIDQARKLPGTSQN
jgi:pyruvate decarboxylase